MPSSWSSECELILYMSCPSLQVLPKGPSENGAMQLDEAEECNMRTVNDFEQELKQRCASVCC